MKKFVFSRAHACLAIPLLLIAASSDGQAQTFSRTYVSGTGTATATCSRSAPCFDFAIAMTATSPGGVLTVLDSSNYSGFTITKSVTIRSEGISGAVIFTTASTGPNISVAAGASDVVTLEGLASTGGGIEFQSGAHLHVVRCVIESQPVANQAGIRFKPNSAARLSVTDTVVSNFGSGTGGGIIINPQSGGSAQVNLERVTINGNAFGLAVDGTGSTAGINATIKDSMVGGNAQDGIIAVTPSGGAPIGVMVKNTASVNNGFGIRSLGANVTVRVDGSTIVGNSTGLFFGSGGALLSAGNNNVEANGSNGLFSASVPTK